MAFSKSFPRTKDKFPVWEEIRLTDQEEREIEEKARQEHLTLMRQCIEDAKKIAQESDLKDFQSDVITIAKSLFDKRASHTVFLKENTCKEKFDEKFGE